MHCKICDNKSQRIFNGTVLQKYNVAYFRCEYCGFIQTEQPYWLNEAYSEAIADLDIGYVLRNLVYKNITVSVIKKAFNKKGSFLDYGGGYGLFVRLMRDIGLNFVRQDSYCENIFAKHFDLKDSIEKKFDLVTAMEVFEHFGDPFAEIKKIFNYSNSILFSTSLQPHENIASINDWDYFSPEMGQHISFYTKKSLSIIAEKFNLNFYTNSKDLHLFTSTKMKINWIKVFSTKQQVFDKLFGRNFCNKRSLIFKDVDYVKSKFINS